MSKRAEAALRQISCLMPYNHLELEKYNPDGNSIRYSIYDVEADGSRNCKLGQTMDIATLEAVSDFIFDVSIKLKIDLIGGDK